MPMPAVSAFFKRPSVKRWGLYLLKAAAVLGVLFLAGRFAPSMPPLCIALLWAALSAVSALGLAHHAVTRKLEKRLAYREGGRLARWTGGLVLWIVVAFVLAAVCVAGLIVEIPTWGFAEWLMVVLAVPLYAAVSVGVGRFVRGEFGAPFVTARVVRWSSAAVTAALCLGYLVVALVQPEAAPASAAEAFQAAPQPFADAPSALMREMGWVSALADGLAAAGTAKAAGVSPVLYLVIRALLCASALFAVASLLGTCSLPWSEVKRVFLPVEAGERPADAPRRLAVGRAVAAGVLPLCLVAGCMAADDALIRAEESGALTPAKAFVREQAGVAVSVIDGTYYEQRALKSLLDATGAEVDELVSDAEAILVPLINEAYDARLANVDGYLDWYYSLPADYERLLQMITGTVEEYVQDQFTAAIEAGVDDSELMTQLGGYMQRAAAIKDNFTDALRGCAVTGIPDWLVTVQEDLDAGALAGYVEPAQQMLDAGERLGIDVAAGATAGVATKVVTKQLAGKVAGTQVFKAIAGQIAKKLGTRAVGSVVGGVVGTIGGPVGTVAGAAVGTAVGVGVDFGLLKFDELQNRERYRQELVDTIEAGRAELLALVPSED